MKYSPALMFVISSLLFSVPANAQSAVEKDCSYGNGSHSMCFFREVVEFEKLEIDAAGNFVVATGRDNARHPSRGMDLEMPQSSIDYFVRYGLPEYASDHRLTRGRLLRVLVVWTVKVDQGVETTGPKSHQLEVQNQAGRIGHFHLSLWRAK